MACAIVLLATVLAAVTPGLPEAVRSATQPEAPSPVALQDRITKPIDLSVAGAIHASAIESSGPRFTPSDSAAWDHNGPPRGISLGPLHTEFGDVTGRHMHLATVKLEGVSVLGANIGGSIDSRSARITFSWPTAH